jgi:alkylhydroperoxidase family enzyme/Ca2+-binding EF-hand superfamily protein/thiol-disulfide isomerase/thioredoxin
MRSAAFSGRWPRFALAMVAAGMMVGADDPKPATARPRASASPTPSGPVDGFDPEVAKALQESWPDHPEWVDMLVDILQGSSMGPNSGWFRTAVTQTRFTWEATRKRLDRDGDGRIAREEYPGSVADFARLDRDRDSALTEADFDFSQQSLAPTPGLMWFSRADRDGNGKVTREEFDALFKAFDSTGQGFVSQNELIEALTPIQRPAARPSGARPEPARGGGGPSKEMLIRGLFNQEIGSLQPGPKLDEVAPDFTLKTGDGKQEITLSKLVGPKPVVLIFGNFTCGPFRSHAGNFDKLHERYKDRATFVMVYVREAHPTDGWRMESNDRVGVATPQPRTYEERVEVAKACGKHLNLGFPMLVDSIDDTVGARYSGMPGRFYLIDRAGKVAFKNGRGPFGFKPAELEHSLLLMLQQETTVASERGPEVQRPENARTTGRLVAPLSDEDAWKRLPSAVKGAGQPLPVWARMLAGDVPRTTAAFLQLDLAQRTRSPLDPKLRAAMRWVAAHANRCDYAEAYAVADARRAGLEGDGIAALGLEGYPGWSGAERAALEFARKMTVDSDSVTDAEFAGLVGQFGEKQAASMVLLMAYANFQDRVLSCLGASVEPGGPMPPVDVAFDPASLSTRTTPPPPLERSPLPKPSGRDLVEDDPRWAAESYDFLQGRLEAQRHKPTRLRVPGWDEVARNLPPGLIDRPSDIVWYRIVFGYAPELAVPFEIYMRTAGAEAGPKWDRIFGQGLFWVTTKAVKCPYCMGHCEMNWEVAGLDKDEIAERSKLLAGDDWSSFLAAEQHAYAFARKLTATPWAVSDGEIATLGRDFGPDRALLVVLNASRYHYMTRISNGFQLTLERTNVFYDYYNTKQSPRPGQAQGSGR